MGRTFWAGSVASLGGDTGAIDALVERGLVVERASSTIEGERELFFIHVLTRDVAYASIPRTRRTEAHAACGVWIEHVTPGREEEYAEILAHHFELADDAARAARYAAMAGDRSRRLFVARDAIRWYERGLAAAATLSQRGAPRSRGAPPPRSRRHVRADRPLPRRRGGHRPGARPRPGSRRRRPPRRGPHRAQPPPLARGPLRRGDRPGRGGRRREACRQARARLPPLLLGRGRLVRARSLGGREAPAAAARWTEAVAAGDRLGEAYALHGLGEAFASPARRPPRSSTETAASALLRELGHRSSCTRTSTSSLSPSCRRDGSTRPTPSPRARSRAAARSATAATSPSRSRRPPRLHFPASTSTARRRARDSRSSWRSRFRRRGWRWCAASSGPAC